MKKLLMVLGIAGLSFAAVGAVNDTLITFSTPGPDTYKDGTVVQDGECYALVWSADGVFEGVKADGTPVDANDQVVLVASVAKDGKCPPLVYQVDAEKAKSLAGGVYGVYLLDTRRPVQGKTVVGLDETTKKLTFVNSFAAASDTGIAGDGAVASSTASAPIDGAAVAEYTELPAPNVAIEVKNATIKLTVTGMFPNADYWVLKGTDLKKLDAKVANVPADGKVELPKSDDAAFFKVKGGRK